MLQVLEGIQFAIGKQQQQKKNRNCFIHSNMLTTLQVYQKQANLNVTSTTKYHQIQF